jgi:hypothetical protein
LINYADSYGSTLWLLTEATYINDEIRDGGRFDKLEILDGGLE